MILLEIQENINKAEQCLIIFEQSSMYKLYKTVGGKGRFEHELRKIYNSLVDLQNSVISRTESIIRMVENKDLLSMVDQNFYREFVQSIRDESVFRFLQLPEFNMPQTSMNMIAENNNVIAEMQAINSEIQAYNTRIANFRQTRNKYYITLYKVPNNNVLPDIIIGSITIDRLLPNREVLSDYSRLNKNIEEAIQIEPIEEEPKKLNIIKKQEISKPSIRIEKKK